MKDSSVHTVEVVHAGTDKHLVKCVVWDLDNTLLLENDLSHIQAFPDYIKVEIND